MEMLHKTLGHIHVEHVRDMIKTKHIQ
jgi:hypothetical protein